MGNILLSNRLTDVLDHVFELIPENLDTAEHDKISKESKVTLREANDFLREYMNQLGGEFNLRKESLHLKMGRYAPHGRYKPYIWGAFIPSTVKAPSHTTPQLYVFRSSKMFGWGLCPSDKARRDSTFMAVYKKVLGENKSALEHLFAEGFVGRITEDGDIQTDVNDFLSSSNLLFERHYPVSKMPSEPTFKKQIVEDIAKLLPIYLKVVAACASNDLLERTGKSTDMTDLFEKWDEWFYGVNDIATQSVPEYLQPELGKEWDDLSQLWAIGRREALRAVELARNRKTIPEELIHALLFGRLRRTAYTGAWRSGVKENFAKIITEVDSFVQKYPAGCNDEQFDALMERVRTSCGFKAESFATRLLCDIAPNVYLPYGQFTVSALRAAAKLFGQVSSKGLSEKNYESMCSEARRLCEFIPDLPQDEKLYVFDHFLYWINLDHAIEKTTAPVEDKAADNSAVTKYWKISCGKSGRYGAIHKSKGVITIGWGGVTDPRKFDSIEKLHEAYKKVDDGSFDPGHAARQCWTFCHDIKKGDYIFGYGPGAVILVGVDQGAYDFVDVEKWAAESSGSVDISHRHLRKVKWLGTSAVETTYLNPDLKKKIERNQTIIPLTQSEGEEILNFAGVTHEIEDASPTQTITLETLCALGLKPRAFFESIERRLLSKRQVVFFGPPGTSKTHIAKHFSEWFAKGGRVASVQFHPSYSYEDFIEGYRPANDTTSRQFKLDTGIFKDFCKQALADQSTRHVFVIDEINRGNLPQIFGELLHLLEYRNEEVTLPYSKSPFIIPDNVYVVATMNSADRSIAMVDYALRRRFEFFTFPADSEVLEQYLKTNNCKVSVKSVVDLFEHLNAVVAQELGKHYQVGHTYFMKPELNEEGLHDLWTYSVQPLLEEYFFDNPRILEALVFDSLWAKAAAAA